MKGKIMQEDAKSSKTTRSETQLIFSEKKNSFGSALDINCDKEKSGKEKDSDPIIWACCSSGGTAVIESDDLAQDKIE